LCQWWVHGLEQYHCCVLPIYTHITLIRLFDKITGITHLKIVVCFLLGNSPAAEFYMPTFRNTLSHLHKVGMKNTYLPVNMEQSIPKRRHIKFTRLGNTQKKAYNIQNTAKVLN